LRAIRLSKALEPSQHERLLQSVDGLIGTYLESHHYRAARKVIEWRPPEMAQAATSWPDQAAFLSLKLGRPTDAERYAGAPLQFAGTIFGPDHTVFEGVLLRYSTVLNALGQETRRN